MSVLLKPLIEKALSLGGHDVHIKSSFPPVIRVANAIKRLDFPPFSPKEMEKLVAELLDPKQTSIFRSKGQVDFSLEYPEMCRIRANAFFQRNSIALSLRLIPPTMPSIHEVGIAASVISDLVRITRGMILITGATGSGKSTTIASFINHLAAEDSLHIVTIEDPIEYVFKNFPQSIISQREVGEDTPSFGAGLTSALRQDPDVILIGELRDQETVETGLKAAETGHLVLGTLHTANAVQSILRLINMFPSHQRDNIRYMISGCLKFVISQILLPAANGIGRILAYEALPMMASVCNLIRQRKVHEINSILKLGRRTGCVPMSDNISELIKSGRLALIDVPQEYRPEK